MKLIVLHIIICLHLAIFGSVNVGSQKMLNIKSTMEWKYDDIQFGMSGCCKGFCAENLIATSTLTNQNDNAYSTDMLKDDVCQTAWVEGVDGDGIGEYLEFEFTYDVAYEQSAEYSCKYTDEFFIVNGYQKNETTFAENNRVKKIKMYIDGKPYCWINLKDEMGAQSVKLGFIKNLGKKINTIKIRFEIAEVYKGTRYNDTAISEIYW